MLSTWLLASLIAMPGTLIECHDLDAPKRVIRSDLETLYSSGKTYIEFHDAAYRAEAREKLAWLMFRK